MAFQISGSTTKPSAQKANSGIMAVDFFAETIIFTNMNVLAQSGAFAPHPSQCLGHKRS